MTRRLPGGPGFRRLMIAQVPADFADWLDFVAVGALLAFVWEAPPVAFAWLGVAMGLPAATIGLLAGVYVDRWPLGRTLVASNLGRALGTGLMVVAPSWPWLILFMFLRGTADAFFTPARQAALRLLVADDEIVAANGMSHGINQCSKVVGPALGGALLVFFAPQEVFVLNAAVSALAALLLLRLPALPRAEPNAAPALSDFRDGLRFVAHTPFVRALAILMAISFFAMFLYDTLIAPVAREIGLSESAFGLVLATIGAGGVVGSLAMTWVGSQAAALRIMAGAIGINALLVALLGWAAEAGWQLGLPVLIGPCLFVGINSSLALVSLRAVLQQATPPAMMGRVAALSEAIATLAISTAPFAGAAIAEALGLGWPFLAGGALSLIGGVGALLLSRGRGGAPAAAPDSAPTRRRP